MDYMRISLCVEKTLSHKILHTVSSDHARMLMRLRILYLCVCGCYEIKALYCVLMNTYE